jgi:hypothetical protein
MADEEPPSLGKSTSLTTPTSAFAGGSAPPATAFSHGSNGDGSSSPSNATPPSDDLNKRWKQYEHEMESRRGESALTQGDMGENNNHAYDNYKLRDNRNKPESARRGVSDGSVVSAEYSFKKSTSYDTNELIRKYSGVTGIPAISGSNGSLPRPTSFRRSSSSISQSSAAVREEALQVLELVDEHLNSPFHVRRTESGGFRAQASGLSGGNFPAPYSVHRTDSGAVLVEHDGLEDEEGAIQPYYVKRSSSGTVTSGRGPRRTPAALSGLGLSDSATNNSRTLFKSGRYSFSDPKFREDDFLAEEEDEIVGPAGTLDDNDPNVEVPISSSYMYRDDMGSPAFDGDFPRGSAPWSSRYSDNPLTTKRMLDDFENGNYGSRERQSARNMFMSTTSSMRDAATNVGGVMATQSVKVFGAGYSFRQSHTFGSQKDTFNLRSMWAEGDADTHYDDDESIQGNRVHKTWQQVMLNKKRRRRIGCSILCLVVVIVVIGVALAFSKDQRAAKNVAQYPGSDIGSPITFYATCNTPYNGGEVQRLEKRVAAIPEDGQFFIHLGNLQNASASFCPPSRMFEMAALFRTSPIPFMVIPGEEDWVKCPDQGLSLTRWLTAFEDIDQAFNSDMVVRRSENNPELFVFLENGVVFFGLHLVSGSIEDLGAHDARMKDMAIFFLGMLNYYKEQFRAIVIMGNARPGHQQHRFFESTADVLKRLQIPVVYVHSYSGGGNVEYTPLPDIPFIHGVQVPSGGGDQPLRISVGFGANPFVVG